MPAERLIASARDFRARADIQRLEGLSCFSKEKRFLDKAAALEADAVYVRSVDKGIAAAIREHQSTSLPSSALGPTAVPGAPVAVLPSPDLSIPGAPLLSAAANADAPLVVAPVRCHSNMLFIQVLHAHS